MKTALRMWASLDSDGIYAVHRHRSTAHAFTMVGTEPVEVIVTLAKPKPPPKRTRAGKSR